MGKPDAKSLWEAIDGSKTYGCAIAWGLWGLWQYHRGRPEEAAWDILQAASLWSVRSAIAKAQDGIDAIFCAVYQYAGRLPKPKDPKSIRTPRRHRLPAVLVAPDGYKFQQDGVPQQQPG